MSITIRAAAPLDQEAALPMALLMQHLREPEGEDLVVAAARAGALSWLEKRVGISLSRRPWKATFGGLALSGCAIRLPMGPVAVSGVTYLDNASTTQPWPADRWDLVGEELRTITAPSWLSAIPGSVLSVAYEAGFENLGSEEPAIQTAALLLAGHFYRNREENAAAVLATMPFGVEMLVEEIRMPVLA